MSCTGHRRSVAIFTISLLTLGLVCAALAREVEPAPPTDTLGELKLRQQLQVIGRYRRGIGDINAWLSTRPDLFASATASTMTLPADADKQQMRDLWSRMLDYYLALDSLARQYDEFYLQTDGEQRRRQLLLRYSAFVAGYRGALDFLATVDQNPAWDTVLNEAIPALGVAENSYQDFKFRYLHVQAGTEFMTLYSLYRLSYKDQTHLLQQEIAADAGRILDFGKGKGELMTLKNALTLIRQKHNEAWLPVQAGIAEWMGDTKILRQEKFLINPVQIRELMNSLEPGDILLQRREWYLSNAGLPGYWPHAALYIGTAAEREAYFGDDSIGDWLRAQGLQPGRPGQDFNGLLRRDFPQGWALSLGQDKAGDELRIIEAISEGVSFTSLEHSAAADSLVILRPRLAKAEKARAIYRAFSHQGKPYDFNFDFVTDNELVCSELVYKAYEPDEQMKGLQLPLSSVLGRNVSTPNDMAKMFDEEFDGDSPQLQMIVFLDGNERQGQATSSGIPAFRNSWRRPKWHILLPEATASGTASALLPRVQDGVD